MPTNVIMPQMGESIAEGTIVRWIKRVGDKVDRDEPLFEISTDKVDAEIPSPVAGVLLEISAKEGETIPVNQVVAVIGDATAAPSPAAPAPAAQPAGAAPAQAPAAAPAPAQPPAAAPAPAQPPAAAAPAAAPATPAPVADEEADEEAAEPTAAAGTAPVPPAAGATEEVPRQKTSPLVRKIAGEHGVDISRVPGTGIGGRVTKQDILDYIDRPPSAAPAAQGAPPPRAAAADQEPAAPAPSPSPAAAAAAVKAGPNDEVVPMTIMRKRIAEHMVMSKRTSAHVHSVFEFDFTNVARIREARKAEYERVGVKLTYLPFIVKAVVDGLRAVPVVNSSIDGENVVYHRDINIGIAVALEWGLIVPVIKHADERNILGLSKAIVDLATRARSKQLKPDEVQGGTFSITNPGVFGALFGTPVISQPQVAILGIGHIEKRPVVVDDAIAVRPRGYMSLGYDHRLIDGAVADEFMSVVKKQIENFDASWL